MRMKSALETGAMCGGTHKGEGELYLLSAHVWGLGSGCVQSSEIILNIQIAGGQTQRKGREELYKSDGDHRMGGLAG